MKWILTGNQPDTVQVFHLLEDTSIKEVLRYHPAQQSVRISCRGRQRLFFIEQAGFRSNHLVFKNEYGFDIGKFSLDLRNNHAGVVELEGNKIHYSLINNPYAELVLYKEDSFHAMASCNIRQAVENIDTIALHKKESIYAYASLLLGLCWYLLNPAGSELGIKDYGAAVAIA